MNQILSGKKIICGVSGSISAYKVCDWVRSLQRDGAEVQVVMTESGARFVSPLTFAALSAKKVYVDMFEANQAEKIPHINLARNADLILIAPATAQTIARLAHGLADDLLSTVVLASEAKVIVCPAMNSKMFQHIATQENIQTLRRYGYEIIDPETGSMACAEEGPGRLPQWNSVRDAVISAVTPQDLAGKTVLVTAGPTEEPFDPVRFIGNRSTGKMGFALAATARHRGAQVILVSGPTSIEPPHGVECIKVRTATEMYNEVLGRFDQADIIVKAAAVSDFAPKEIASQKVKKNVAELSITLQQNRDILQKLGEIKNQRPNPPLLIGFAAESDNLLIHGREKLEKKNLDYIVINDITTDDSGFAVDTNRVVMLDRSGNQIDFPLLSKEDTARKIWDEIRRETSK